MVVNLLFLVVQQKPPLSQTFCISLSRLTTLSDGKTQSNLKHQIEVSPKEEFSLRAVSYFSFGHGECEHARAGAGGESAGNEG